MRKLMLTVFFMCAAAATATAADVPAYRASFTATGSNPVLTVTPEVGDTILVFAMSDQLSSTQLGPLTATDSVGGTYWDQYCGALFQHSNGKYARLTILMRRQLVSSASSFTITVDTGGKSGAAIAVAVSGLTAINNYPSSVNGCGTLNPGSPDGTPGSVRQVKNNGSSQQFAANELPVVPKFGQSNAFLSTSMTFTVLINEEASPSPLAPTDWTQRATAGVGGSKAFGLSVATRDSGFSGSTVTWGSTTPTRGNAAVVELQSIVP